jgi:hypothetical protein
MTKPSDDIALLTGPTEDQKGMRIVRFREESVSLGEVRPVEEGKPIHGEIVALRPRSGAPPFVRDVETVMAAPSRDRDGPAQVANEAYRSGWEATFTPAPDLDRSTLN